MKRILIVDDEVQILRALSRVFYDTEYEILTADKAEDALRLLEDNQINLVISDMRMPFIDGYELLSKIKEKYPNVIRAILSGYSDEKTIFKAILHNIAKVYIFKPWNNEELLQYIYKLFAIEDILTSKELLILINNLDELPTISSSYQKILSMIEKEEDFVDIAGEIEKDLAISTKLLHVANSVLYGGKTGSIKQAVIYLGLQNTRSIILSTSIINSINATPMEREYAEILWKHAQLTNNLLLFIYEEFLHTKLPEAALTAGLLHDIGVVIMIKKTHNKYLTYVQEAKAVSGDKYSDILKMELSEFKVTHQETGGYLLSWWELPFPIVEVALFHHRPFDTSIVNVELVSCVHIAQKYALDIMGEPVLSEFYPETFKKIGIIQQEFEERIKSRVWVI